MLPSITSSTRSLIRRLAWPSSERGFLALPALLADLLRAWARVGSCAGQWSLPGRTEPLQGCPPRVIVRHLATTPHPPCRWPLTPSAGGKYYPDPLVPVSASPLAYGWLSVPARGWLAGDALFSRRLL